MSDLNQSEFLTEELKTSTATIRELRRVLSADALPLAEEAKILNSILRNMCDAVMVADRNESLLVFNPAAERMFGSGAVGAEADKWPQRFGLYLSDQVTPFPAEKMPLCAATRVEEVDDVKLSV